MGQFIRLVILGIFVILILYACNLFTNRDGTPTPSISGELTPVRLTIQAVNATEQFNRVGQVITYNYVVTNTGTNALPGPVTISDDKVTGVICPNVNTVGNLNDNLDFNESISCTGTYGITQADLNAGQVTNNATATVNGVVSAIATATVRMAENKVLTIAKAASPMTYNAVGQTITYTYTINNTGAAPVGPAQFVVRDDRMPTPINCGAADTTLATNQPITCTAIYTITQNDMTLAQITNSATASGGGAGSINPATVTITNGVPPPGTPSNLQRGSTIRHKVVEGEWMLQIARCYGADFNAVLIANPGVTDADLIFPFPKTPELIIPNIGSVGQIYGPVDCVVFYTVKAGDSWESIARQFNADLEVLRAANVGKTATNGVELKIPRNSAGSTVPVTPQPVTPIPTTPVPTTPVPTSGAVRVADINTGAGNSDPSHLAVFNGTLYYSAIGNDNTGAELWKFEGALGAASRVADINPGPTGSDPSYLTDFNGALYFKANGNDGAGVELWRYNGSATGRLSDINSGSGDSNPSHMAVFNNALYFSANGNDGNGVELWRTDGTTATLAFDIHTGSGDSNPAYLTVYNGALYFSATSNDGAGTELWKYDGTTATRVSDINAGVGNSNPAHLEGYGGMLYFSANANDGTGTELWRYDGTNPPTRAADINPGAGDSAPTFLTDFNGALYFSATGNDNAGIELWKFDGTTATRAADINPNGNSSPAYLAVYNNELYFRADGGDGAGVELWKFK